MYVCMYVCMYVHTCVHVSSAQECGRSKIARQPAEFLHYRQSQKNRIVFLSNFQVCSWNFRSNSCCRFIGKVKAVLRTRPQDRATPTKMVGGAEQPFSSFRCHRGSLLKQKWTHSRRNLTARLQHEKPAKPWWKISLKFKFIDYGKSNFLKSKILMSFKNIFAFKSQE
jgi:hypothetical protein